MDAGPKAANIVMVYCMENTTTKQGQYVTYTPEQHAQIGKYTVKNGPLGIFATLQWVTHTWISTSNQRLILKYIFGGNNIGNLKFGDPTLDHQITKFNFSEIFLAIYMVVCHLHICSLCPYFTGVCFEIPLAVTSAPKWTCPYITIDSCTAYAMNECMVAKTV